MRDRSKGSRRVQRLSRLMNGNNRRCLSDGRKEIWRPGKIEDVKKTHARARRQATLSELVAVNEKRFVEAAKNWKKSESRKWNKTPQGMWPDGARASCFWLCYARVWLGNRRVRSRKSA